MLVPGERERKWLEELVGGQEEISRSPCVHLGITHGHRQRGGEGPGGRGGLGGQGGEKGHKVRLSTMKIKRRKN